MKGVDGIVSINRKNRVCLHITKELTRGMYTAASHPVSWPAHNWREPATSEMIHIFCYKTTWNFSNANRSESQAFVKWNKSTGNKVFNSSLVNKLGAKPFLTSEARASHR